MRSFRRVLEGLAAAGLVLLIVAPGAEAGTQNARGKGRRRAAAPPRAATNAPPGGQTQTNSAVFIGGGATTGAVRQNQTGGDGVVSGAALGAGVGGVRQNPTGGGNNIVGGAAGVGAARQPTGVGSNVGQRRGTNAIGAGGAGTYARGRSTQPTTARRRRVRRGRN